MRWWKNEKRSIHPVNGRRYSKWPIRTAKKLSSPWVFPSPNDGPINLPGQRAAYATSGAEAGGTAKDQVPRPQEYLRPLALPNGVDVKTVPVCWGTSAGFILDTHDHVTNAVQRQAAGKWLPSYPVRYRPSRAFPHMGYSLDQTKGAKINQMKK